MANQFYHATTRKLFTIFGAIFNEIEIQLEDGSLYKLPLRFSSREKFLTTIQDHDDKYKTASLKQTTWLAFDFVGMSYDTERSTNNTKKLRGEKEGDWMYNRTPYNLNFNLYLSSKHMEPSLQVIEQIIPLFSPSFNVKINEIEGYKLNSDITVTLDSIQPEIEVEGSMTQQRNIFWTLQFTLKGWYYPIKRNSKVIKQTIADILTQDKYPNYPDDFLHRYTSTVDPFDATKNDPHKIIETVESKP